MLVSNRDNQKFVQFTRIHDCIRKSAQSATAYIPAQRMPRVRMSLYQIDCAQGFKQKSITQSSDLSVVVCNRFIKLCCCRLEQTNVHHTRYLASTSASGMARICPFR